MRKLAIFTISFTAAIAIWMNAGRLLWPVFIVMSIIGIILFVIKTGENRIKIVLSAIGIAAGLLWIFVYGLIFYEPAENMAGESREIVCEVTDYPRTTDYGVYARVKIKNDSGVAITAQLRLDSEFFYLLPGDNVTVKANLSLADKMTGEDTDYYFSNGIFLKAYQDSTPKIEHSEALRLRYIPSYMAKALKEKIQAIFPSDTVGFVIAILTGDRSELPDNDYTALQESGAAHVVAVSGLHVSFLIGMLMTLTGKRRRMSLICIPVLFVFMAMVGFSPSVVRAGIMQIFVLLAPALGRENDTLTSLSASLLILLLVNPYSIASTSLQLSFTAVLGINIVTPKLIKGFKKTAENTLFTKNKRIRRASYFIIDSLSTSIGAMVFTIPVMAVTFEYISVYSPITNILVLWAVSIVFAVAGVACLLGFLLPFAGGILACISAIFVKYILLCCYGVSALPGSVLYTLSDYIQIWLISSYIIVGIFCIIPGKNKRFFIPVGLCATLFCLSFLLTSFGAYQADMEITVLDVGQGQSVVFTMNTISVMVDCGSETRNTAGERAAKYLFSKNLFNLDFLILTHFDADHVNGVTELMDRVSVGTLIIPEPADPDNTYVAQITELAEKLEIDVCIVEDDMLLFNGDSILSIYAPVGSSSDNDSGLAVVGTCGDFDILITGDMSSSMEKRLVKLKNLPDIEVLIVGHHGSKYSSSEELLETVKAEVAIISAGEGNYYGHPTQEAITRLVDYGSEVFRTDQMGNITVKAR